MDKRQLKDRAIRVGFDARIFSQAMNGVARYATALLTGLAGDGHFEIYLFSDTPLRDEYKEHTARHRLILLKNRKLKKYWKNWILPVQLLRCKIDLYHATWDKGMPVIPPVKSVMDIHDLYSISPENTVPGAGKKSARLINYLLETSAAKKIFTTSENAKKEIVERLRVKPEKVVVTYLGCNASYVKSKVDQKRRVLDGDYFISIVGRLDDVRKNAAFLIKAFGLFLKTAGEAGGRYKLAVVGSGDEKSEPVIALKKLIASLGLDGKVVITGYLDDTALYSTMAGAKAMIFPSLFEGFGIPILEAFLLEVPVITSNTSSMPEIASGRSALLIDPRSEASLADAITALCKDESLRGALAAAGLKRCGDFDWKLSMSKIINTYEEIYGKR